MKEYQVQDHKKGFTLIEILVAVAIIGILATILIANFQGTRARARDAKRKRHLNQLKTALRMYYNDFQEYPTDNGSGQIQVDGSALTWGSASFEHPDNGTVYMGELPEDPRAATGTFQNYYYVRPGAGGGDTFELYACLENLADQDKVSCHSSMDDGSGTDCPDGSACFKVTAD
jgi:type II secretion system protein G